MQVLSFSGPKMKATRTVVLMGLFFGDGYRPAAVLVWPCVSEVWGGLFRHCADGLLPWSVGRGG